MQATQTLTIGRALRGALLSLLVLALLVAPIGPMGSDGTAHAKDDLIVVNVGTEGMAMEDFLRTVSRATQAPLIWNPNDKAIRGKKIIGSVNLEGKKSQFFDLFRSLLTFYELVIIPVGPADMQVFLVADARQTSSILKLKPENVQLSDANVSSYEHKDGLFITTTIPVEHMEDLRNARNALTRIVTGQNIGNVTEVPGANAFVVTDFAPNVCAIYRLIREMDVPSAVSSTTSGQTVSLSLEYAKAAELAAVLQGHFAAAPRGPQNPRAPQPLGARAPRITADARANKILVTGTEAQIAKVKQVIAMMDVPVEQPSVMAHYVRLKHVDAQEAAGALTAFAGRSNGLWRQDAFPSIVAHEENNALLISADRRGAEQLLRLISEMDQPEKK